MPGLRANWRSVCFSVGEHEIIPNSPSNECRRSQIIRRGRHSDRRHSRVRPERPRSFVARRRSRRNNRLGAEPEMIREIVECAVPVFRSRAPGLFPQTLLLDGAWLLHIEPNELAIEAKSGSRLAKSNVPRKPLDQQPRGWTEPAGAGLQQKHAGKSKDSLSQSAGVDPLKTDSLNILKLQRELLQTGVVRRERCHVSWPRGSSPTGAGW